LPELDFIAEQRILLANARGDLDDLPGLEPRRSRHSLPR
jgi:hypothetical protein